MIRTGAAPHGIRVKKCANLRCNRPRMRTQQLCQGHWDIVKSIHGLGAHQSIAAPIRGRGCDVVGCRRPHVARGWCRRHYDQQWHGRQFSREPDVDVIETDVALGIDAEAIARDNRMSVLALKTWLSLNGRRDLSLKLRRSA